MPIIDYYGHRLTIDGAYSYDRVSSPQQTPEQGGEGIDRQALLREEFSERFGVPIDHTLADLGKSGTGEHLEDGAALAAFMKLAIGKKLKPNSGLLVESFSRLSRLPIDDAMSLFLDIVRSGVTLVTLVDHRAYTRASLRANPGEIHTVSAHLQAARAESEARGYFSRSSWAKRRHKVIAMCPGWLRPNADHTAYEVIPGAAMTIRRIFREAEYLGLEKIAARLNADGIQPFEVWNHKRTIWYGNHISRLIKGRAVRGEREIGEYEGVKRTKTGQYVKRYPDNIVSEEQWQRSNAALVARQSVSSGRKGEYFSNLFQSLAKCAHCGAAMKLSVTRKRGRLYQYFRCVNVRRSVCDNRRSYDYAKLEFEFIDVFQDIVAAYLKRSEPQDDPATPIREKIASIQAELLRLEERAKAINGSLQKVQERTGSSEEEIAQLVESIGIIRKKPPLLAEIAALERTLAQMQARAPAEDVAMLSCNLVAELAGARDQYEARAKVNTQLKRFIVRIEFDRDGLMRLVFGNDGKPLEPHPTYNPKWRTDYRIRFSPDGVKRDHPWLATLRPIFALRGNKLAADEFNDAWRHPNRRKRLRPTDKTGSEATGTD